MPPSKVDTMNEILTHLVQELARAGTFPDADIEFLAKLQAEITQKIKEGGMAQGGPAGDPSSAGAGAAPPGAAPPGGMDLSALMGGGPGAQGGGAMPPRAPMPNGDELARMIGPGANGGAQ